MGAHRLEDMTPALLLAASYPARKDCLRFADDTLVRAAAPWVGPRPSSGERQRYASGDRSARHQDADVGQERGVGVRPRAKADLRDPSVRAADLRVRTEYLGGQTVRPFCTSAESMAIGHSLSLDSAADGEALYEGGLLIQDPESSDSYAASMSG